MDRNQDKRHQRGILCNTVKNIPASEMILSLIRFSSKCLSMSVGERNRQTDRPTEDAKIFAPEKQHLLYCNQSMR